MDCRLSAGSSDGRLGTAHDLRTPSISSRKSWCSLVAAWRCTTKRCRDCFSTLGGGSGVSSKRRFRLYSSRDRVVIVARSCGDGRLARPSRAQLGSCLRLRRLLIRIKKRSTVRMPTQGLILFRLPRRDACIPCRDQEICAPFVFLFCSLLLFRKRKAPRQSPPRCGRKLM